MDFTTPTNIIQPLQILFFSHVQVIYNNLFYILLILITNSIYAMFGIIKNIKIGIDNLLKKIYNIFVFEMYH